MSAKLLTKEKSYEKENLDKEPLHPRLEQEIDAVKNNFRDYPECQRSKRLREEEDMGILEPEFRKWQKERNEVREPDNLMSLKAERDRLQQEVHRFDTLIKVREEHDQLLAEPVQLQAQNSKLQTERDEAISDRNKTISKLNLAHNMNQKALEDQVDAMSLVLRDVAIGICEPYESTMLKFIGATAKTSWGIKLAAYDVLRPTTNRIARETRNATEVPDDTDDEYKQDNESAADHKDRPDIHMDDE